MSRRLSPITLVPVALLLACAPRESATADSAGPANGADTASATAIALPGATVSPAATGTPSPTDTAARATGTAGTKPAPRRAADDSGSRPRIKPPSKAPGGFIVVPRNVHDSLRMKPPATGTSGTSTRP